MLATYFFLSDESCFFCSRKRFNRKNQQVVSKVFFVAELNTTSKEKETNEATTKSNSR